MKKKNHNKLAQAKRMEQGLTKQDFQIIKLICQEKTSKEIAIKLGKSKRTIENSRLAIIKIIGCKNVIGVVRYAINEGIV